MTILSLSGLAQRDPVVTFSKNYFRSDPFKTSFNSFIQHLTNDPDLVNKIVHKKTDTSLFLFSGFYKTYKPLKSAGLRSQAIFEQRMVQYRQDASADTILMYHLVIYADDSTEKGETLIKREYDKIVKKYQKRFYTYDSDNVTRDGQVVGGITNFFVYYADMSPVTVGWMKVEGKPQTVLNLSMRLINNGGMVEVPLMQNTLMVPDNTPITPVEPLPYRE